MTVTALSRSSRTINVPPLPDLSPRQKWHQEVSALGFVLSVHPLTLFEPVLRTHRQRTVPASDLARHIGRRVWVVGWPVTRKEVLTQEGKSMEFVSFEDQTAIYETVFFPRAFQRFCQDLDMGRPYLLYGEVQSEFGAVSLTVHQLLRVREDSGKVSTGGFLLQAGISARRPIKAASHPVSA